MNSNISKELVEVMRKFQTLSRSFVVIGGVSTFIYDYHEKAKPSAVRTTFTSDIDLAVRDSDKLEDVEIEKIFKELGYSPEMTSVSESSKPLIKYSKKIDQGEIEVESLVPLIGPERTRGGKLHVIKNVMRGLVAQQLRYLDILLDNPYRVKLSEVSKDENDKDRFVQIPSPGNYLLHKFLTLRRRQSSATQEKDAFYIFDILNRFEAEWNYLGSDIKRVIETFSCYREVKSFVLDFEIFFKDEKSEGIILLMNEYERGYKNKFNLSRPQAVKYFSDFIKVLKNCIG